MIGLAALGCLYSWVAPGALRDVLTWLYNEGPNPYSCAAMGEFVSVAATVVVSKLTRPLPRQHVEGMFGSRSAA